MFFSNCSLQRGRQKSFSSCLPTSLVNYTWAWQAWTCKQSGVALAHDISRAVNVWREEQQPRSNLSTAVVSATQRKTDALTAEGFLLPQSRPSSWPLQKKKNKNTPLASSVRKSVTIVQFLKLSWLAKWNVCQFHWIYFTCSSAKDSRENIWKGDAEVIGATFCHYVPIGFLHHQSNQVVTARGFLLVQEATIDMHRS